MKKIILGIICMFVLMIGVSVAYNPTSRDSALISQVNTMVSKIDTSRLEVIEKKIDLILEKSGDRFDDRTFYLLDAILVLVQDTIYDRHLVAEQRRQESMADISFSVNGMFSRRATNGMGFGMRMNVYDDRDNAKNPVLTVSIPNDFCLEYNEAFLPMSMAYYSTNYGLKWRKFSQSLVDEGGGLKTMCDVTSVKVVLPDNMEMFNGSGYGFSAIRMPFARNHVPFCLGVVLSADNAQYEEGSVCFHTTPDEFRDGNTGMRKSFATAKADGDISIH